MSQTALNFYIVLTKTAAEATWSEGWLRSLPPSRSPTCFLLTKSITFQEYYCCSCWYLWFENVFKISSFCFLLHSFLELSSWNSTQKCVWEEFAIYIIRRQSWNLMTLVSRWRQKIFSSQSSSSIFTFRVCVSFAFGKALLKTEIALSTSDNKVFICISCLGCLLREYEEPIEKEDRPGETWFLKATVPQRAHLSFTSSAARDKSSGCTEERLSLQPHGTIETPSTKPLF